ncbi:MAG: response regulator [Nitrospirae bacterium]|nr:response regulator [Nitrospirota bacterium]
MKYSNSDSKKASILVVEDESIVAMSIRDKLIELGYSVVDMVDSGHGAIKSAQLHKPDLVLMDIVLKGTMDGVEAAQHISNQLDIPVIFLTAYSDQATLNRAKITEPYGYLLKPFEQRELYITVEIALYKHKIEKKLNESHQWLQATLKLMGCAVIMTDLNGRITFMNPSAASITGWKVKEAIGENIERVFSVMPESPVKKTLEEGLVISKERILTTKDAKEVSVDFSAVAITDDKHRNIGIVIVIHNVESKI